jgi:antitoxin MazE
MQTSLRKMGNSAGAIIPKPILDQLGLPLGAKIDVRLEDGKVILEPVKRKVREGWEEGAKAVAAAGMTEEEREWLQMPYDFDDEWEW